MKHIPLGIKIYLIAALMCILAYPGFVLHKKSAVLGTTTQSATSKADICNRSPNCSWQAPNCVCKGDAQPITDQRYKWNEVQLPVTPTPFAMPVMTQVEEIAAEEVLPAGATEPEKIESIPVDTKTVSVKGVEKVGTDSVKVSGKGPKNTTIYLYIFSKPTVVAVETDENGEWTYTFKNNLENGNHTVYASVKKEDESAVRSAAHPFTVVQVANAQGETDLQIADNSRTQIFQSYLMNAGLLLTAGVIGVMLLIKIFSKRLSYQS